MVGEINKGWLAVAGSIITSEGTLSTPFGIALGGSLFGYCAKLTSFKPM
jgi:hypothetical protein